MAVLLIAEVTGADLAMDATAKAATAAKALGDVTVLCASAGCGGAAAEAATISGVSKVLCADDAAYGNGLAEPIADLVVSLAGDYEHIVAPATASAKNVLPRVAALLDVMVISDVTAVVDGSTFERPIYAGNAMQTVQSADAKKVLTVRTSTFDAAETGGSAAVETIGAAGNPGLSEWVEDKVAESDRPELTSAGIVVSGGRGVGSEEQFAIIESLADKTDFVELRSRRPRPRTLTGVERRVAAFRNSRFKKQAQMERDISRKLINMENAVKKADRQMQDSDLGVIQQIQQGLQSRSSEARKFSIAKANLDKQLKEDIDDLKAGERKQAKGLENRIRVFAVVSAPLPAFLLGLVVLFFRISNENRSLDPSRRRS